MTEVEIKELALNTLDSEITSQFKDEHIAILEEVCETIANGKSLINGKNPSTREEYLLCIYHGLEKSHIAWSGMITAFRNSQQYDELNINYRGRTFTYKNDKIR